jgi:acetyl esterase
MLDPQAEPILRRMTSGPPLNRLGVDGARQWARDRGRPPSADVTVQASDLRVPGWRAGDAEVTVRLYRPVDPGRPAAPLVTGAAPLPALLYLHGGGWILGDLDGADWTCRQLCALAGCAVVSVDYRLAPEHPYPAPLEDGLAALRWTLGAGTQAGLDPARIAVAGESSGGQLAASLCLAARDEALGPVALQLLVCPVTDSRMATSSWRELGQDYLPCAEQMSWMWDLYCGSPELRHAALVSVAEAPDLAGLPSAIIVTAEYDPLRDEAEQYGVRLRTAGVPVSLHRYPGQVHTVFGCAPYVDRCWLAFTEVGREICRSFRQEG